MIRVCDVKTNVQWNVPISPVSESPATRKIAGSARRIESCRLFERAQKRLRRAQRRVARRRKFSKGSKESDSRKLLHHRKKAAVSIGPKFYAGAAVGRLSRFLDVGKF